MRVGMVSCRVRRGDAKVKCYRCMAHGHEARSCQGPDRTKCCRRCGLEGRFVNTCAATQEDALSFTRTLATTSQAGTGDAKTITETK